MVVRFVPVEDPQDPQPGREHEDLAEVIDFRSRLRPLPATEQRGDTELETEFPGEVLTGQQSGDTVAASDDVHQKVGIREQLAETIALYQSQKRTEAPARVHHRDSKTGQRAASGSTADAPEPDTFSLAKADGVRVLAKRAKSSGELKRELQKLEHSGADIERVVTEFAESLYLDDHSLARTLTERLRDSKGASRSQIRTKLRERLLDDAAIEAALGELDEESEDRLLRETAYDRARKLHGLDRATAERRLLGYLSRRGWSGPSVYRIVSEALGNASRSSAVRFE